jgi:hypothetical protein
VGICLLGSRVGGLQARDNEHRGEIHGLDHEQWNKNGSQNRQATMFADGESARNGRYHRDDADGNRREPYQPATNADDNVQQYDNAGHRCPFR